jgi:hypothetical protein
LNDLIKKCVESSFDDSIKYILVYELVTRTDRIEFLQEIIKLCQQEIKIELAELGREMRNTLEKY